MRGTLLPLHRLRASFTSRGWPRLRTEVRAYSNSSALINSSMASWTSLPWQGNLKNMDSLPTLNELQDLLQAATAAVQNYQQINPHVKNLNKLVNKIRRDLSFIESQRQLLEQQSNQLEVRTGGIVNNLRGFHGELLALHEAPGVIAVCQRFRASPPKIWAPTCSLSQKPLLDAAESTAAALTEAVDSKEQQQAERHSGYGRPADTDGYDAQASDLDGSSSDGSLYGSSSTDRFRHVQASGIRGTHTYSLTPDNTADGISAVDTQATADTAADPVVPVWVEVDVVANEGLTWIEVKNQERFGVESVHWLGSPGHGKGLAQQIRDLQAVAAAPVNSRRWRAPDIVVFFPSSVDEGVAAALRDMGVKVAAGPGSLSTLHVPQPPSITNLDVTSLCALVSEVSWGDPHSSQLKTWAAKTVHWRDCLAAQTVSPLLAELHACLDTTQRLVTSCLAVEQFQKLVDMFAGPKEQQRWLELQQRVQVYHCSSSLDSNAARCAACGTSLTKLGRNAAAEGLIEPAACGRNPLESQSASSDDCSAVAENQGCSTAVTAAQQQQTLMYAIPDRISRVDKLTKQQRTVLGLGDALQALTLTANGSAVRSCEHYGVRLEAAVHRPVWLTGM